jgi:hypothetical protein
MATVRVGLAALRFGPFPREPVAEATGSFQWVLLTLLRFRKPRRAVAASADTQV